MSGEQYNAILSALADKMIEQDCKILRQKWEIDDLKKKLAEAEKHLNQKGEKPKAKTLEIR